MGEDVCIWRGGVCIRGEGLHLRRVCPPHPIPQGMISCYHLQTKFAKVMFSQVSVRPQGGVCPIAYWDTPPGTRGRHRPPWADTPLGRHTPRQIPPLGRHHPPQTGQTPPPAQCMLGYGQQAGDTHPIGIHSSLFLNFDDICENSRKFICGD